MALSTADLTARIGRQLALLGFDSVNATSEADILRDAVRAYVSRMDLPIASASMAVVADDDGPYSIPSTIGKIIDIRDTAGASVVWTTDTTVRKVTLQDEPSASGNYTVYGTYKEITTNLDTITAAITEDHESLVMAFCVAYAKLYALSDDADKALALAHRMAALERRAANRTLDMDFVTVKHLDTRGQNVADASNHEGHDVDIDDDLAGDL